jgi:hypothetical protein
MSRCLEEKALLLLSEGGGSAGERSHLQNCRPCMARYDKLTQDLWSIAETLRGEPPPLPAGNPRAAIFYRSVSIAAGLLLVIALVWGERGAWRANRSALSEQGLNSEVSQFLEQVSEAVFASGRIREADIASSESDLASIQIALGENCSAECRQFFSNSYFTTADSTNQPVMGANQPNLDPAMRHTVSNWDE